MQRALSSPKLELPASATTAVACGITRAHKATAMPCAIDTLNICWRCAASSTGGVSAFMVRPTEDASIVRPDAAGGSSVHTLKKNGAEAPFKHAAGLSSGTA
ncbi:MAG: hypothetical protein Tsb007_29950 [Rhizobacter sp.]